MTITFAVDDVIPAATRLAEHSVALSSLAQGEVLGASADAVRLVAPGGLPKRRAAAAPPDDRMNPLVQAVDLAFNEHRPLRLSPDVIWATLAQGFAIHVRECAEALRSRFVRHEGRVPLVATCEPLPRGAPWARLIADLSAATSEHLGPGLVALLTRPFSTTDAVAQTVFQIALLDAFAPYFEYGVVYICGIPTITLTGTVDDWRDIKRRVEVMGEYDLRWWTDALLPICDQWIATAEGNPDAAFWQSIHRPLATYGGHLITGWLPRLFPYVGGARGVWRRFAPKPARRIPEDGAKPRDVSEAMARQKLRLRAIEDERGEITPWAIAGVSPSELPPGWSHVQIHGEGAVLKVSGGLLGVAQDPDALTLSPTLAWLVETDPTTLLWRAFAARHATTPRVASPSERHRLDRIDGVIGSLFERFERASLYDGRVEITRSDPFDAPAEGAPSSRPMSHTWTWILRGFQLFARVQGGGALAIAARPDIDLLHERGVVVRGRRITRADFEKERFRQARIEEKMGWVVYLPDLGAEDARDAIVVDRDASRFVRDLVEREGPWFLEAGAGEGRYVELLRALVEEDYRPR